MEASEGITNRRGICDHWRTDSELDKIARGIIFGDVVSTMQFAFGDLVPGTPEHSRKMATAIRRVFPILEGSEHDHRIEMATQRKVLYFEFLHRAKYGPDGRPVFDTVQSLSLGELKRMFSMLARHQQGAAYQVPPSMVGSRHDH